MLKIKYVSMAVATAILTIGFSGSPVAVDCAKVYKAKTCWACHGKDAKTPIMPVYPALAGQNAGYAFSQIKDIKSGDRSNGHSAAMKGVMSLVSEAEMRTIANWLATLSR